MNYENKIFRINSKTNKSTLHKIVRSTDTLYCLDNDTRVSKRTWSESGIRYSDFYYELPTQERIKQYEQSQLVKVIENLLKEIGTKVGSIDTNTATALYGELKTIEEKLQ